MTYTDKEFQQMLRDNPAISEVNAHLTKTGEKVLTLNKPCLPVSKVPVIKISEQDFQQQVIDLAHSLGWKIAHFRPALTDKGWRTAVSGDGAGFLDNVLVRERVIWAELKVTGKLSPQQLNWFNWLKEAEQEVYVWRPADFDQITEILRRD